MTWPTPDGRSPVPTPSAHRRSPMPGPTRHPVATDDELARLLHGIRREITGRDRAETWPADVVHAGLTLTGAIARRLRE